MPLPYEAFFLQNPAGRRSKAARGRLGAKIMTDEQLAAMHRLLAEYHRKLATESLLDKDTEEDKWDENLTLAIETYLANEVHTPEQAKAKAIERSGIKDRRTAFHIVRDPPPDKQEA